MQTNQINRAEPSSTPAEQQGIKFTRFRAGVVGFGLIALCIAIWIWPHALEFDTSDMSRRGRNQAGLLNLLWSRPLALAYGIFGGLVAIGVVTGIGFEKKEETSQLSLPSGTNQAEGH
jgi:hypothetical protein